MFNPEVTDNSYAIIVTPTLGDDDTWTGEVSVSISLSKDNTLSQEDKREIEMLCEYMASVLPAIEDNDDVRELIGTYVGDAISRLSESSIDNGTNQQVFNFLSPTKGNA